MLTEPERCPHDSAAEGDPKSRSSAIPWLALTQLARGKVAGNHLYSPCLQNDFLIHNISEAFREECRLPEQPQH